MAKKHTVPDNIIADIKELAKGHTKRLSTPPHVVETIRLARAHDLPWRAVVTLLAQHYDQWALSKAALIQRNKREGWGL